MKHGPGKHNCPVCRGAGVITLPHYTGVMDFAPAQIAIDHQSEMRVQEYSCPHCLPRVADACAITFYSTEEVMDPRHPAYVSGEMERELIYKLIRAIYDSGLIRFAGIPGDSNSPDRLRATIGVLSPEEMNRVTNQVSKNLRRAMTACADEVFCLLDDMMHQGVALDPGTVRDAMNKIVEDTIYDPSS